MENKNALDEISKGTHMGMDAIDFILDKTVSSIIDEYVTMQEDSVEKLKTFL